MGLRGRAGGQPEDFDSRKSERYLYEWALFPQGKISRQPTLVILICTIKRIKSDEEAEEREVTIIKSYP